MIHADFSTPRLVHIICAWFLQVFFGLKNLSTIFSAWKLDYNSVIILAKVMTVINKTRINCGTNFLKNWKYLWFQQVIMHLARYSSSFWAFAQHWRSKVTVSLVCSVFTCLVTATSDWSKIKLLLNLRVSSSKLLLLLFLSLPVTRCCYYCTFQVKYYCDKISIEHLVQWSLSVFQHNWWLV